jgi:hypothetical protein
MGDEDDVAVIDRKVANPANKGRAIHDDG